MYLDNHFRHVDLEAALAKDSAVTGLDHAPGVAAKDRDTAP